MLDTRDFNVFIGQTPYPGRVNKNTAFVIRYHDALPVFMPHTIPNKSLHQATHFYALMSNVRSGAWFACVSEATRQDLLRLFPEVADKAVTIHNMVSHHYYKENSDFSRIASIIRGRLHEGDVAKGVDLSPKFLTLREKESFYNKALGHENFKYLLIVSTVEPRKNHTRLLAAWEVLKADVDANIKLVIVGGLGWDYISILKGFNSWIDRGELFMLSSVPSPDLRVLYRHAAATVCPSLGEGFDFSGVESMASGGITIASDIPVHREIYDNAAEYFDPYATMSLVNALKKVLYEQDAPQVQEFMRQRGEVVSSRYLPENILPQWESFLRNVVEINNVSKF
jgi:glycosyltransferase involved in cell wall biosynthesis